MTDVFLSLLLLVPATAAAAYLTGPESLWTFAAATLGVIPLAEWIRRATEHLALRAGPAIGGLLNVSFGNTADLVLALFVLAAGKPDVVKAQLTGSIIGNSLLGLGLAIVVGSIGRDKQTFKRARAGQLSSLLVLSMIGLLLPALFDYVVRGSASAGRLSRDEHFSLSVSVVLILVYVANLIYTPVTHRDGTGNQHHGRFDHPDRAARGTAARDRIGDTRPPMNLVFSSPLELIAIAAVTFTVNAIAQDGETTWFEGVLLLAIYALFTLAFFFV